MISLIKNQMTEETFYTFTPEILSKIGTLIKERGDVLAMSEHGYMSTYRLDKSTMGPRHLRLFDTTFQRTSDYIFTRKHSPRLRELNRHLGLLRDSFVLAYFRIKSIPYEADVRYAPPKVELNINEEAEPLQLQHYYTITGFFTGGLLVACICFIIELINANDLKRLFKHIYEINLYLS